MATFQGLGPPRRILHASLRVFSVKPGAKQIVRLVGEPRSFRMHRRPPPETSKPCLGDKCPWCTGGATLWKGYAAAEIHGLTPHGVQRGWHKWVLEITPEAAGALEHIEVHQVFTIRRAGAAKNSACIVEPFDQASTTPACEAFPIRDILLRLWGLLDDPRAAAYLFDESPTLFQVEQLPGKVKRKQA